MSTIARLALITMPRQQNSSANARSRRYVPAVRQLRLDIDAEMQPSPDDPTPSPDHSLDRSSDSTPDVSLPESDPPSSPESGHSDWGAHSGSDDGSDDEDVDVDLSVDDSDDDYEPSLDHSLDSDEEVDYVSLHNTSTDSDEPLDKVRLRRNPPGTDRFKWRDVDADPCRYGFRGDEGIKLLSLTEESSPREIFDAFFTPELWDTMTIETNRYAAKNPPTASRKMKSWVDVDKAELQRYLGLRLMMGIKRLPSFHDYWSTRRFVGDPEFRNQMTRDRFDAITTHLHFSNNDDPKAADDRMWKLRPVIDTLARTFKDVYTPGKEVAVDESLFRYRGRHHAIQFVPSKRARYGLKAYKLSSSEGLAQGYTSAMKMYMGKDRSVIPASQKAVIDLMDAANLFDKGYTVYTDNWYSSPSLFHYLQTRSTNAVGTVRPNRKYMPGNLKVKKKGDLDRRSTTTGMSCLAWMDKVQVNMLSTIHQGSTMMNLPPNRRGEVRVKPEVVVEYNDGKKGVDVSDQLATYYHTPRKCRKWYLNLFFHLVDTAVVNAYVIKRLLGGRMKHKEFNLALVDSFCPINRRRDPLPAAAGPSRRRPAPARRSDPPPPLPAGHQLVKTPKPRRCKQCKLEKRRRAVKFACSLCDVGLCPAPCFATFHQPG